MGRENTKTASTTKSEGGGEIYLLTYYLKKTNIFEIRFTSVYDSLLYYESCVLQDLSDAFDFFDVNIKEQTVTHTRRRYDTMANKYTNEVKGERRLINTEYVSVTETFFLLMHQG